jgi:hypothetical protein
MTGSILQAVLLSHLAATLFMVGAVWFVQVVHYPLMAGQSAAYAREHGRRTGWVLGPVMLVELGTACLLAWAVPAGPSLVGLALLLVIWASTFCVQVPCHNKLVVEHDAAVHRRLVATNWLRTLLWSVRGVGAVWAVVPVVA